MGPFYASFVIILLNINAYKYATITGLNGEHLWVLARSSQLCTELLNSLVLYTDKIGFETDKLIYVNQQSEYDKYCVCERLSFRDGSLESALLQLTKNNTKQEVHA